MCECHHRCWLDTFVDLVIPNAPVARMEPGRNLDRFDGWLAADSVTRVTVAEIDHEVVAYSAVHGNELLHLFVDPSHAGKGLGRGLLATSETLMSDAGHRTFVLHTMVGNTRAIALYQSAGWHMTDQLIHSADDHGVSYDEHVLVKQRA